jgi:hypothetical protein
MKKKVETIQKSGHRAAAIVQDLLTIAKGVATTKEPLFLNDLVRDYINSPEFKNLKSFYSTVTVKTNLDKDLLNISGSYVHIRWKASERYPVKCWMSLVTTTEPFPAVKKRLNI